MANKVDLHSLFLSLQTVLTAKLQSGREHIVHPVVKGDNSELNWRKALVEFLPARYSVERAIVIDSTGATSEQIDLILFDRQYSPLIFNQDGALYVPAESVYAAIEAKQEFTKDTIEYAGDKIASVRRLHRTSIQIQHAGGTFEPRPLFEIIGSLVALESSWNPPLGDTFRNHVHSMKGDRSLQVGCALRHGAFDMANLEPPMLDTTGPETSLIFFLLRLFRRLQLLGSAPAVDLLEYGRHSGI